MTVSAPRFCKDCRYAVMFAGYLCDHPSSIVPATHDPVTGELQNASRLLCISARRSLVKGRCGEDAVHWKARKG